MNTVKNVKKSIIRIAYSIIALGAVLTMTVSCGKQNSGNPMERAIQALNDNRPELAQEICDSLTATPSADTLSVGTLCRLSSIYIALAQDEMMDENTAQAAKCIQKAYELDSTYVNRYISGQPVDQISELTLVLSLSGAMDSTSRSGLNLLGNEEDSIQLTEVEITKD